MSTPYPSAPGDPEPDGRWSSAAPPAVRSAMAVVWTLVAFQAIRVVLLLSIPDQFVGPAQADRVESGAPSAVGVVGAVLLIGVFVFVALSFQSGRRWARTTLIAVAALFLALNALSVATSLGLGLPMLAIVLSGLQVVLLAALLTFLVRPEAAAWCRQ